MRRQHDQTAIKNVVVEVYRVFPADSNVGRTSGPPMFSTPNVPTRVNSPSDVALDERKFSAGSPVNWNGGAKARFGSVTVGYQSGNWLFERGIISDDGLILECPFINVGPFFFNYCRPHIRSIDG